VAGGDFAPRLDVHRNAFFFVDRTHFGKLCGAVEDQVRPDRSGKIVDDAGTE
jgi:hypothetical protein